jgi:hypothetical protein
MTPSGLNQAIRERYNAVGDTFFNDNMVWDLIYQAQMMMAQEAFVVENTYTTTSVASTRNYAFPTSSIALRKVEYDGDKLNPVSVDQDPKTSTTEVTGTPGAYTIWNNEIILYPTPSATGDTIEIYTYNEPQAVTSTSTLDVPSEYHLDIIDFGLSVFYAKDGNPQMADYHRALWDKSLQRIKRTRAKKRNSDQFVVVRDQDSDPGIVRLISG